MPQNMKKKLDRFPTQLVLTFIWIILAIPTVLYWQDSILWIGLISVYAIVISHFTAHLAWKSKRAAEHAEEDIEDHAEEMH